MNISKRDLRILNLMYHHIRKYYERNTEILQYRMKGKRTPNVSGRAD